MNILNNTVVIKPAKLCHNQRLSLIPIAHHYETPGEPLYIKYGCPLCEAAENIAKHAVANCGDSDLHFYKHQVTYGENCSICGVNLAWDKLAPEDDDYGAMPTIKHVL